MMNVIPLSKILRLAGCTEKEIRKIMRLRRKKSRR